MSKRSASGGANPYKVLYWLGAGLLVLAVGVVALVMLVKPAPRVQADPERTMVWLYESGSKGGPALVTLIEESRGQGTLRAVSFGAPNEVRATYADRGARRAQEQMAVHVNRTVHHRVFLPLAVVATLIDAAGGIDLGGKRTTGADAAAFIREGGDREPGRGIAALLALSEAIAARGINLTVTQGLGLAREVETDLELMAIPEVLGRWSGYAAPELKTAPDNSGAAVQLLLQPDPLPPARP